MPIYEYVCSDCGHELEALQKLSDAPLTDCPSCVRPALKKRISAAGFRLTGSGWYETDFKNKSKPKPEAGGDKDGKTASDKKSESKGEAGASAGKEAAA